MSLEQAKACIEKLKTDEAFRASVLATEGVAARVRLVNREGFACGAEELKAASTELSDEDLNGVSGGVGGAEASYEYLVGMFGAMVRSDSRADLSAMQGQLASLKGQGQDSPARRHVRSRWPP